MSVDTRKLKVEDKVKFGKTVVRKITRIEKTYDEDKSLIDFEDGFFLHTKDPLWELAELEAASILPIYLELFVLTEDGAGYRPDIYIYPVKPAELLRRMRLDLISLEAALEEEE
jgi:hypothetical protein